MYHFCTLFDKNYLVQAVALYRSLERTAKQFTLYVLCMDQTAFDMIGKLHRQNLVSIHLSELLQDEETREVRGRTTHGQFCWVSQPLVCLYLLDRFKLDMVTYLEADSLFFSDPGGLFKELEGYSISLVPHRYTHAFDNTKEAGRYCVQFNAFRNNKEAREVLAYWKQSCFRYTKDRPAYYPGQTSLDDWPKLFQGVREIENIGAGAAPWNIQQYAVRKTDEDVLLNDTPLVFYHYHQYSRYADGSHELGFYPLTRDVIDAIYVPYIAELTSVEQWIRSIDPAFTYRRELKMPKTLFAVLASPGVDDIRTYVNTIRRKLKGTYNVFPADFHKKGYST